MAYIGNSLQDNSRVKAARTITVVDVVANTITFTPTGGYVAGFLDVYKNKERLVVGVDYQANNGTTVVLTANATSGDTVEFVSNSPVAYDNVVKKSGDTLTGTLTTQSLVPDANVTYDIGTDTMRYRDLYLSGTTIQLGNTSLTSNAVTGALIVRNPDTGNLAQMVAVNSQLYGTTVFLDSNTDIIEYVHINNGLISIGNSTVNTSITKDTAQFSGTLTAYGNTTVVGGDITVNTGTIHVANATGNSSFGGNVDFYQAITVNTQITARDLTLTGNLNVTGTLTSLYTANLEIGDSTFVVNAELPANAAPSVDAGFVVNRGSEPNTSIIFDELNDRWDITGNLYTDNTVQFGNTLSAGNTTVVEFTATGPSEVQGTLSILGGTTVSNTLLTGNTTISGFANVTGTLNIEGTSTLNGTTADSLVVTTSTSTQTLASGNTIVTGFANVIGTIESSGNVTINGQLSVTNAAATGNTTVTGFANVTGTLQVGGSSTLAAINATDVTTSGYANVGTSLQVAGATTLNNTLAAGNTTVTGFANVSGTLQVAGATTLNNTLAAGNTTVTGVHTVTGNTTVSNALNVDGSSTLHALAAGNTAVTGNVTVSQELTVTGATALNNTLAAGNTTVTGFVNTTTLTSGTSDLGNTTVTGFANVSSTLQVSGNTTLSADVSIGEDLAVTGNTSLVHTSANTLAIANYIDFANNVSAPAHKEGRVFYDMTSKTLSQYVAEADVTLNIGQENWIYVYNNSGATINNGKIVYLTGTTDGVPNIALADASDSAKIEVIGLATHDIENASYGYVTAFGIVRDVDTSNFNVGQKIHLSASVAGGFANIAPTYPNYPVDVGFVAIANATTGCVLVKIDSHTAESYRVTGDARIGGDLTIGGNITVLGDQTVTAVNNLEVANTFIYLGSGDTVSNTSFTGTGLNDATIVGHFEGTSTTTYYIRIDGTGANDTFEWSKDNFSTTEATDIPITGAPQALDSGFSVEFQAVTGHTLGDVWAGTGVPVNLDFAIVGNFANSTVYSHAGMMRDASDDRFKFFRRYDPEVTGNIDTGNTTFWLADVQANNFYGTSFNGALVGNASTATALETGRKITLSGDVIGNTTFNGTADVTISAALNGNNPYVISNTFASGNTTITGFANVTSNFRAGGTSTLVGATSITNTLATGNTTVTGFANVTSTLQVGGAATIGTTLAAGNTTITGTGSFSGAVGTGNLTVSGFANTTGSLQVGSSATIGTTLAAGNTTVTGFANVTSTLQVGGTSTLTGVNSGNTTVTGFANVTSTLQVGGTSTLAAVNSGNLVVTGTANVSSSAQIASLGVGTAASGTAGEIRATNNVTAYYSDERLKTNIECIENALDKLQEISGVYYTQNKLAEKYGYNNYERQVGVLAGQIKKVMPEAVKPAPFDRIVIEGKEISRSGEDYMTVQYEKLVPLLIEAIKELKAEVDELKKK